MYSLIAPAEKSLTSNKLFIKIGKKAFYVGVENGKSHRNLSKPKTSILQQLYMIKLAWFLSIYSS